MYYPPQYYDPYAQSVAYHEYYQAAAAQHEHLDERVHKRAKVDDGSHHHQAYPQADYTAYYSQQQEAYGLVKDPFSSLPSSVHQKIWSHIELQTQHLLRVVSHTLYFKSAYVIRDAKEFQLGPCTLAQLQCALESLITMECTEIEWIRIRSIIDSPTNYSFFSQQSIIDFVRLTKSNNLKLCLPAPFSIKDLTVISNYAPHLVTSLSCGHHSLAGTLPLFSNVRSLMIVSPSSHTIVLDTYPNYAHLNSLTLHRVSLPAGPLTPFASTSVGVTHVSLSHVDGHGALYNHLASWPLTHLCIHDTTITGPQLMNVNTSSITHFGIGVNSSVGGTDILATIGKCGSLRSLWMCPIPFRDLIQLLANTSKSSPVVFPSVKDLTFGSSSQCVFPHFPAAQTDQIRSVIGPLQVLLSKFFPSLESIPIKFSLESWQTYPNLAKLTKLELKHPEGIVTTDLKPFLSSSFNLRQFSLFNFHQINREPLIISHPQLQELHLGRAVPTPEESFKIATLQFEKLPSLKTLTLDARETTQLVMSPGALPQLESLHLCCSIDGVLKHINFSNLMQSLPLVAPHLRYLSVSNVDFRPPELLLLANNFPGWVVWHSVAQSTAHPSSVYEALAERVSEHNQKTTPKTISTPRKFEIHNIDEFEQIIYDVPAHEHNFLKWKPEQVPILLLHTDFHLPRK